MGVHTCLSPAPPILREIKALRCPEVGVDFAKGEIRPRIGADQEE